MDIEVQERWLLEAIDLSRGCPPTLQAFSVGAVITDGAGNLLTTGYSRAETTFEHAEELALRRAQEAALNLQGAVLYSSLEPCSVRLSGRVSCTERIIRAGIARVVFALREPALFVRCDGAARLRQHGIDVHHLVEFAPLVTDINRHLPGMKSEE